MTIVIVETEAAAEPAAAVAMPRQITLALARQMPSQVSGPHQFNRLDGLVRQPPLRTGLWSSPNQRQETARNKPSGNARHPRDLWNHMTNAQYMGEWLAGLPKQGVQAADAAYSTLQRLVAALRDLATCDLTDYAHGNTSWDAPGNPRSKRHQVLAAMQSLSTLLQYRHPTNPIAEKTALAAALQALLDGVSARSTFTSRSELDAELDWIAHRALDGLCSLFEYEAARRDSSLLHPVLQCLCALMDRLDLGLEIARELSGDPEALSETVRGPVENTLGRLVTAFIAIQPKPDIALAQLYAQAIDIAGGLMGTRVDEPAPGRDPEAIASEANQVEDSTWSNFSLASAEPSDDSAGAALEPAPKLDSPESARTVFVQLLVASIQQKPLPRDLGNRRDTLAHLRTLAQQLDSRPLRHALQCLVAAAARSLDAARILTGVLADMSFLPWHMQSQLVLYTAAATLTAGRADVQAHLFHNGLVALLPVSERFARNLAAGSAVLAGRPPAVSTANVALSQADRARRLAVYTALAEIVCETYDPRRNAAGSAGARPQTAPAAPPPVALSAPYERLCAPELHRIALQALVANVGLESDQSIVDEVRQLQATVAAWCGPNRDAPAYRPSLFLLRATLLPGFLVNAETRAQRCIQVEALKSQSPRVMQAEARPRQHSVRTALPHMPELIPPVELARARENHGHAPVNGSRAQLLDQIRGDGLSTADSAGAAPVPALSPSGYHLGYLLPILSAPAGQAPNAPSLLMASRLAMGEPLLGQLRSVPLSGTQLTAPFNEMHIPITTPPPKPDGVASLDYRSKFVVQPSAFLDTLQRPAAGSLNRRKLYAPHSRA